MKTKKKSKSKPAPKNKTKVLKLAKLTADELFLNTLRDMGKPSLVREMAVKLQNGKLISKSKDKLMALLYASASHLTRDGFLKRFPVNNSMYRYSLLEWKKSNHKMAA